MTDVILTTADDPALFDLRVGDTCLVKGKLEGVRYGGAAGRRRVGAARMESETISPAKPGAGSPSICINFPSDWSLMSIYVRDEATARAIRYPLQSRVTVRCQVISEDAELAAIAIWEDANPVPIIVGEMQEIC